MRQLVFCALGLALVAGCSGSSNNPDAGPIVGVDGGKPTVIDGGNFLIYSVPVTGPGPLQHVAAAQAADGRIGIAYYKTITSAHYELDYAEVSADLSSTVNTTIETDLQRLTHLTVAFDSQGSARVGYLGADPAQPDPLITNAPDGGIYWYQNDFAVATVTPQHTLAKDYAVHTSGDAPGPIANLNDFPAGGGVVGISPSLVWTGSVLFGVYRDIHGGQFPVQDYGYSDFESFWGQSGAWNHLMGQPGSDQGGLCSDCVKAGFGANTHAALSADGKKIGAVFSGQDDNAGSDRNVYIKEFDLTNKTWGGIVELHQPSGTATGFNAGGDLHGGPKIAAIPGGGWGVAYTDYGSNILHYTTFNGTQFGTVENAVGSGTSGWMPALAIDPGDPGHGIDPEPVIAYYHCSNQSGASTCSPADQQLRVTKRTPNGQWSAALTVDASGGYYPTVFVNPANGQITVVYRSLVDGGVRIAVQKGN